MCQEIEALTGFIKKRGLELVQTGQGENKSKEGMGQNTVKSDIYLWIAFFFSTFASLFQNLVVLGTLLALMKTNSIDNRKKKIH